MRDLVLTLVVLCGLSATFRFPFAGLLLWILFAVMNPHDETYSFARTIPWNLIIAVVTTASWLLSSERKVPPKGAAIWLVLGLLAWCTFNTFFAFDPKWSFIYWNRAWKTIVMCVLAGSMTVSRVRFHAVIWVATLALCYFGIKGGLFTIVSGGSARVMGPPDTWLSENNVLADALVMILPLLNYLRLQSDVRLVRQGIIAAIVLTVASILGSYSREAYISLFCISVAFWLRTKNKLIYPVCAVLIIVPLLKFMPESFWLRADSIQNYSTDASFQARVDSWWLAYHYAMDHIPFGAGFYGMNLQGVWDLYMPGEMHAIHSIYFQMLGEQGVVGLAIYLVIIANLFLSLRKVRRNTKGVPELAWANELANMMQLSALAFCIGGAAAPIDFFDIFFLWVMLAAALLEFTKKRQLTPAAIRSHELQPPPGLLGARPRQAS